MFSRRNYGSNSFVENIGEEGEPFLPRDLTIIPKAKLGKKAVDGNRVDAIDFTLAHSDCLELFAIDLTIAVKIKPVILTTYIFESLRSYATNISESFTIIDTGL